MPLKLYIESSMSVIPALRARPVQLSRPEQRQTGAPWALQAPFLLQEHPLCATQGAGSSQSCRGAVLAQGCSTGGSGCSPSLGPSPPAPSIPSALTCPGCAQLWGNRHRDPPGQAPARRSWSWAPWGTTSWPGSLLLLPNTEKQQELSLRL